MAAPAYITHPEHTLSERFEQLIDTVGAPRKAFESINSAPSLWLPFLMLVAIRVAGMFTYFSPSLQPAKLIVSIVLATIPVLIQLLLVVGCIWFAVIALGGETDAAKVTSLTASALAVGEIFRFTWAALENLLGVTGSGAKGPVFSNLGFLVPDSDFALRQLLSAADIVTFYIVVTIGLGLLVVARKLSTSKAMVAAAAPWLLYTLVGVSIKIALS